MTTVDLTPIDAEALAIIVKRGPISCANLGDALWYGKTERRYGNCSCPFARPAGKVVARLRRLGLVCPEDRGLKYEATARGRAVHAGEPTS